MSHEAAVDSTEGRALPSRRDSALGRVGPGRSVPGERSMFLVWFTEEAMAEVENLFVADTHERIVNLLKGANRAPSQPDLPHF
ncbi:aromatic ring-cleaving dioxygenase [Streptomyces sp. V3I8]|uniref:hypothetical protein n=1 Tax=Streptomyces sp. V3I8 TaxID=3042279 RepID=UPI002780E149|nr:hypothetical protein [Streptomyces sp. V3I8]MDQ1036144.1 aromatic ring-cleaving dioxygenase [Streptomyces sp. V3I8]